MAEERVKTKKKKMHLTQVCLMHTLTGERVGWRTELDGPLSMFLFLGVRGRGKQLAFILFC